MIAATPPCDPVAGFPVRIVRGAISCAAARGTLQDFLDDGSQPSGWFCARGHDAAPYAAQCSNTPDGDILIQALVKPSLAAPASARIGRPVRVVATGVSSARYSLTLVYDRPPAHNARCLADIGKPKASRAGSVVLSGTIPRTLTCYQGVNVRLGAVPTAAGPYHFVVGEKLAHNGWEADASFMRRAVRVRA